MKDKHAKALKKKQQQDKELMERMKALGVDESVILAAFAEGSSKTHPDTLSLEAELALFYVKTKGKGFIHQICPQCTNEFAYYYKMSKGEGLHCSDECRAAALKDIGIIWNPMKPPHERFLLTEQTEGDFLISLSAPATKVVRTIVEENKEPDSLS